MNLQALRDFISASDINMDELKSVKVIAVAHLAEDVVFAAEQCRRATETREQLKCLGRTQAPNIQKIRKLVQAMDLVSPDCFGILSGGAVL